jgi:hypothetical protein|tara:strand:+ start:1103 stop:1369 length:267 start_codon:yes stop_codon:yes gene_type:complete
MAKKTTLGKMQKKQIAKAFDEKPKAKKGSAYHNCITSNLGRGVSYAAAQESCKTRTVKAGGIIGKAVKAFKGRKKSSKGKSGKTGRQY